METRLFRPQPFLVAEALVSRMKQLVPCLAAVCLLPLSTSCAGSPGLIPPVTTKQHESELCHIRIGRYLAPAWSRASIPIQLSAFSQICSAMSLFPKPSVPSGTSTRPPPRVMLVEKSYTSSSAQRDDTAAVLAPCLLTIRDRISILDWSMDALLFWASIVEFIFSSFTRSFGAKHYVCPLGRLGRLRSAAQFIELSATVASWVRSQPLALGSDASCCCCRQERSADDGATSQQGAAFSVPLSSTILALLLVDLASLALSLSTTVLPPWLASRSVPRGLLDHAGG